jgi:hypothetical protein
MRTESNAVISKWIEELETSLSEKLKILKKDYFEFFENNENANNLTNLAIELEEYLKDNSSDIEKVLSQFTEIDGLNKLNLTVKDLADFTNNKSDCFFENSLAKYRLENVKSIYEFYKDKLKLLLDKIVNKLNGEFTILNY